MYKVNEICKSGKSLALTTEGELRVVFIGTGSAFAKRRRQPNILVIQGNHHVLRVCCYLPTHSHADHIDGLEEVALINR